MCRAGGADVVDLERHLERKVVRDRRPARAPADVGGARDLDLGVARVEAGDRVQPQRRQGQRGEGDDPRPDRRRILALLADPVTVPSRTPPESVSGLCILPRSPDDLQDPIRHRRRGRPRSARGCRGTRWSRGRAAPPPARTLRAHRPGRVEPLGRLRQRSGGTQTRSAPSCSDVERSSDLHERSLGTLSLSSRVKAGRPVRVRRPTRGRLIGATAMDLAMPVVWSDRHRLHEPGGEIWVGRPHTGHRGAGSGRADPRRAGSLGASQVEAEAAPRLRPSRRPRSRPARLPEAAWRDWRAAGLTDDPGQDRVVPYVFPHPGLIGELTPQRPAARSRLARASSPTTR